MRFTRILPVAFLLSLFLLPACDNEIELAAPWKDIPVVYAILNASQPTQYVRVEKAFLDPVKGAPQVAQIVDSLYYAPDQIQVFLVREKNGAEYLMERFDGDQEGLPRKSGIFAASPNWLYRVSTATAANLPKNEAYTVKIRRKDNTLPDVTATTIIPDTFKLNSPSAGVGKINFFPNSNNSFEWVSDANAVLFNVDVLAEVRTINNNQVIRRDTIFWPAVVNEARRATSLTTNASAASIGFYEALNQKLSTVSIPTGAFRQFDGVRIRITGGGKEIQEFQVSAAAAAGVSGAESIPIYTNVTNGLGLVTAVNQNISGKFTVENLTKDSIKIHPLTKDLKFEN